MTDFCELFSDSHCPVEFSLISVVDPIVPGRPKNLHYSRTWAISIALAVGAGGGCLDIFSFIYHFSFLSPSLWETARYRLKYCLKGPLSLKQPTNQLKPSLINNTKTNPWNEDKKE